MRELLATEAGNGIVGAVSFDANGDPIRVPITIYRVDSYLPYRRHRGAQGLEVERVLEPPPALVR